ncbi:hypothetical protein HYPSUDRAFT_209791 [Hypholoma sublateritium FD-334 SS-4]|uniref:Uncharacterized protein n=1 Tax=Hypholoma sublateritium (strain FD-334 SS-4) TaxID=945553 RepID=A0A0D2N8Y4_HYPSF|nr:hypothetical protein HYPSUDRAFT_209791 [Hypholoma sublateritium FD-334 SS-4]
MATRIAVLAVAAPHATDAAATANSAAEQPVLLALDARPPPIPIATSVTRGTARGATSSKVAVPRLSTHYDMGAPLTAGHQ